MDDVTIERCHAAPVRKAYDGEYTWELRCTDEHGHSGEHTYRWVEGPDVQHESAEEMVARIDPQRDAPVASHRGRRWASAVRASLGPRLASIDGVERDVQHNRSAAAHPSTTRPSLRLADDPLLMATKHLIAVVHDSGALPVHHYRTMNQHRSEWPALWAAIDAVEGALDERRTRQ